MNIDEFCAICPLIKRARLATLLVPLAAAMEEFAINSPARQAAFVAQLAHESGSFVYLREIASGRAYEGRLDLGNTEPNDGVTFKGWGWMQTTGRKNTQKVSQRLYGDDRLVQDPSLIDPPTLELAARAAGDFWTIGAGENLSRRAIAAGVPVGVNLNNLADQGAFELITLAVNGGTNGLEDRLAFYKRAQEVLA